MAISFTEKIYNIYFKMTNSSQKSGFRAFCILLKSINFTPNEAFINNILSTISKPSCIYMDLLMRRSISENNITKFSLSYTDIDAIIEALLYLKTRMSSSLMYSLCEDIRSSELKQYLKGIFYAYFNLIKNGKIWEFNHMSISNQLEYLLKNIPSPSDRKIYNYGPRATTNSGVWGSALPFYIKSIPMGGRNKKY